MPEHDIEQYRTARRIGHLRCQGFQAERAVDHRVRPAPGQLVGPEVDHLPARVRAQLRVGDQGRLRTQGAAGEQAPQRTPPRRRGRGRLPGRPGRGYRITERLDHGGQVGTPRPEQREAHRRAQPPRVPGDPRGDLGRGRLGHHHDQFGGRVGVQHVQRGERGPPGHRGGQVPPAHAQAVRDAHAGRVEQAHHLLRTGTRRGDQADRAGPDHVGEAEADPADDRRTAVRPHHEQPVFGGPVLEPHLVSHRDVVGEQQHRGARVERVERVEHRVPARRRDEHQVRPGTADGRPDGAGRNIGRAAGRRGTGRQRGVHRGERAGQCRPVAGRDGDQQVLRPGARRRGEPEPRGQLQVEPRRHGDERGGYPGPVPYRLADLHQLD